MKIVLTGKVVERRDAAPGDIALSPCLSKAGRQALAGGHCNYGYSGFWRPFVCLKDGKFKRIYVDDFSPYRYETQDEKEEVFDRVAGLIAALAGQEYDLSKPIPEFKRGPDQKSIESVQA